MQKAGSVFFIGVVMSLVLIVSLIIGGILWMDGMQFFFPLLAVLYGIVGIFVIRAVVDWKKNRKLFNRIMAVAVALSVLYAVPGLYEKSTGYQAKATPSISFFIIK